MCKEYDTSRYQSSVDNHQRTYSSRAKKSNEPSKLFEMTEGNGEKRARNKWGNLIVLVLAMTLTSRNNNRRHLETWKPDGSAVSFEKQQKRKFSSTMKALTLDLNKCNEMRRLRRIFWRKAQMSILYKGNGRFDAIDFISKRQEIRSYCLYLHSSA